MAETLYIDNAARKRIVTFWIPVCLVFLHAWASLLVIAMIVPTVTIGEHNALVLQSYPQEQLETIYKAFKACQYAIWGLIFLLISDKAVEFFISRVNGITGSSIGHVVEKTTTEKTVVTPSAPVKEMNVEAENVTVSK